MLETIAAMLVVQGLLGLVTATTMGGFIHILLVIAIVLSVAGVLGLAYGGFSYDKQTTGAKLGPIELKVTETKTVNVPMWAGIGRDRRRRLAAGARRAQELA